MKSIFFYETEIGRVGISENGAAITDLFFEAGNHADKGIEIETPLLKRAALELREYLEGNRILFDLPIEPAGTEFQKTVWKALCTIPYGETRSYKQIAEYIGRPKAPRAVGMANNKNPILFIIPCHRVIGSNGKLVGYAAGLDVKDHLLKLESGR